MRLAQRGHSSSSLSNADNHVSVSIGNGFAKPPRVDFDMTDSEAKDECGAESFADDHARDDSFRSEKNVRSAASLEDSV
ncbi:hypothetical protein [Paraburkholderia domus]|uniref:hypothetical protein n=1 Tax=Paraburkholderia domus TaxID=2793075 RepID=UPI00191235F2|nr:hypothetical protein [Paraburkholderia domus]MBK5066238.1 hypothetical protein [Burkholderia sp. R-70199]MBK5185441.1 hypothetical protein [Burkholderia sp. R-69749]